MRSISDILWDTMKGHYRSIVDNICGEYESNPKYKIKKFYENGELTGFCVYYDESDYRMLEAGYYVGGNRFTALRMWKFVSKTDKPCRAFVQKVNSKIVDFYIKMGFKVVNEDSNNYLFER